MPRGNRPPDVINRARVRYAAHEWRGAFEDFAATAAYEPLEADDLERLTLCAALIGRDEQFFESLEKLYELHKGSDAPTRAARYPFWWQNGRSAQQWPQRHASREPEEEPPTLRCADRLGDVCSHDTAADQPRLHTNYPAAGCICLANPYASAS